MSSIEELEAKLAALQKNAARKNEAHRAELERVKGLASLKNATLRGLKNKKSFGAKFMGVFGMNKSNTAQRLQTAKNRRTAELVKAYNASSINTRTKMNAIQRQRNQITRNRESNRVFKEKYSLAGALEKGLFGVTKELMGQYEALGYKLVPEKKGYIGERGYKYEDAYAEYGFEYTDAETWSRLEEGDTRVPMDKWAEKIDSLKYKLVTKPDLIRRYKALGYRHIPHKHASTGFRGGRNPEVMEVLIYDTEMDISPNKVGYNLASWRKEEKVIPAHEEVGSTVNPLNKTASSRQYEHQGYYSTTTYTVPESKKTVYRRTLPAGFPERILPNDFPSMIEKLESLGPLKRASRS